MVRPTLEYGSEVWEDNKAEAAALDSVMIGGAKCILGCSLMRLLEVTWGWIHYRAKLKWWYKVATSIGIQGSFLCRSGM